MLCSNVVEKGRVSTYSARMTKFATALGMFLAILGSSPAQAQKSWTIEQVLNGSKYQCAGTDDASANFKISFERVRRHRAPSKLVAFYSGELASGVSVNTSGINAQIDMIDPINKKFEMDISDFPSISLFHKGHARHLQTRAYFNSAYATIEGKLS